jgi:hypothetical protein
MKRFAALFLVATASSAHAQHHHHEHESTPEHRHEMHESHEAHASAGVLGIPMSRRGSGTSWVADASPMRGTHLRAGGWDVMLHGNVFAGYVHQSSDAGDSALASQNWIMAMADHALAGGAFTARTMLSLEPLTMPDGGYPLLLQTGETHDGMLLVDRQHPHDLVMEAAASYARPIGAGFAVEGYGALAGEPAFGPVAFPHRPSSFANPLAPLGHHLEDSTHISFGVVTAGLMRRDMKGEVSWFNGQEPDEDRYDLDLRKPDSYAARLSVSPSSSVSLQGSYAILPKMFKSSYSITHAYRLDARRAITTTGVVGQNFPEGGLMTHAVLVETAVDLYRQGITFARVEQVVKRGADFGFPAERADEDVIMGSLSLGHTHPIVRSSGVETSLGLVGSVAVVGDNLVDRYGTRWPLGAMAYVQLAPR